MASVPKCIADSVVQRREAARTKTIYLMRMVKKKISEKIAETDQVDFDASSQLTLLKTKKRLIETDEAAVMRMASAKQGEEGQ